MPMYTSLLSFYVYQFIVILLRNETEFLKTDTIYVEIDLTLTMRIR